MKKYRITKSKYNVVSENVETVLSYAVRRAELDNKSTHIVTINPEIYMMAKKSDSYHAIVNQADIITCDGFGIKLSAYIRDNKSIRRVTGVDLLEEAINRPGYPILIIGAAESSRLSFEKKMHDCGRSFITGSSNICINDEQLHEFAISIAKSKIDQPVLVFVALGAPKQEYFIKYLMAYCTYPIIAIGCGGAVDRISGSVKSPPRLVTVLGFEWIFRLIMQPKRFGRMIRTIPNYIYSEIIT